MEFARFAQKGGVWSDCAVSLQPSSFFTTRHRCFRSARLRPANVRARSHSGQVWSIKTGDVSRHRPGNAAFDGDGSHVISLLSSLLLLPIPLGNYLGRRCKGKNRADKERSSQ
jgi:hypothetical protein